MIVRILNGGQFEVPDDRMQELNRLDNSLTQAVDAADEAAFRSALGDLLSSVESCDAMPDDYLGPSDLILPSADASMEEVKELLTEEGLIPGV